MPNSPIITCSVIDTNSTTVGLTGDNSVLIRYFSNAKATMSAEAQGGAAIDNDMYIIRNGNQTGYGTEHTFTNVSSAVFSFSAEDSNGNIGQKTYTATMINYIKLTCNVVDSRPDASGDISLMCRGDYFNGSFGSKTNSLTVKYRYRVSGGSWSGYNSMTVSKSGNTFTAQASLTGLDYQNSYDFEYAAQDQLMSASAGTANVRSVPVFHWGGNDVVFEVPVEFKKGTTGTSVPDEIDGDLKITGNLRLKGDGNYGNLLYFGDSAYCYIGELSDDALTIKANSINLSTGSLTLNGNTVAAYGTWTPTISGSGTYETRQGWYSKVGNVVTVGFMVKVSMNSGYSSMDISISGLPFTPLYASAGGGMCSGALIQSDKNFQCFVAEKTGSITTRAQACDDTSGTNLATSASGCKYPASGTLTLSGTITYTT